MLQKQSLTICLRIQQMEKKNKSRDKVSKEAKNYIQWKVDRGVQRNVLPIRLLRLIAPAMFDGAGNPKPEALHSRP